jgi:hypothetical protein
MTIKFHLAGFELSSDDLLIMSPPVAMRRSGGAVSIVNFSYMGSAALHLSDTVMMIVLSFTALAA